MYAYKQIYYSDTAQYSSNKTAKVITLYFEYKLYPSVYYHRNYKQ